MSKLHPGVQNFWVCGLLWCPQTVIDLRKGRLSFSEMMHNDGVKEASSDSKGGALPLRCCRCCCHRLPSELC